MRLRLLVLATLGALALLAVPLGASAVPPNVAAATSTFDYTKNLHPLGYSAKLFPNNPTFNGWNSDLAFWGNTAYQGTINGFRILDVSSPANPRVLTDFTNCPGDQGDVIIWDNILVRSWNSPAPAGGSQCGGLPVPQGQEGLHVFDVSNPASPQVLAFVNLACGSHTATAVPDPANNRLLVYNGSSGAACPWIDIVSIPLNNPAAAAHINRVDSMHTCHDIGVILGNVLKAACAGGQGVRVFSLGGPNGGSLDDPELLWHRDFTGVTIGHSASWSWDGEVLIFGHEPGGGVLAQCQATTPDVNKTLFFISGEDGTTLGTLLHPRPQGADENCTWHNYNVVPTDKGRILISGNYQSGISAVDFTDPANPYEFAYADPASLGCCTAGFGALVVGGDWSSYWYNGRIYESDITRGLLIWKLSDPRVAGAKRLAHLNPQTQETSFSLKANAEKRANVLKGALAKAAKLKAQAKAAKKAARR